MKPESASKIFAVLLACLGLAGHGIILYTTRWGIGLFGWDSFSYIAGARNLAQGNGYVFPFNDEVLAPVTHFPPGLPFVLAIFERLGVDTLDAARGLNAVLFGLSAILTGLTIRSASGSAAFGLLGSLFLLTSATLIEVYSLAMSEGLYLFLTLTGFLLLAQALQGARPYVLVAAVLVFGVTGLTRLIGVANIAAAVLAYFLWSHKPFPRKAGEAALFGILSLLPALWWTARVYTLTETVNDREFGFNPIVQKNVLSAVETVLTWFIPERFVTGFEAFYGVLLLTVLLGGLAFSVWYGLRKTVSAPGLLQNSNRPNFLIYAYVAFLLLYPAAVFGAKFFLDPNIGMSDRILSPLLLPLTVLGMSLLSATFRSGALPLRWLALAAAAYLLFYNFYFTRYPISDFHKNGLGMRSAEVRNSEAIQALPELVRKVPVYSNDPFTLYFTTGRVGYRLNSFSPEELSTGEAVLAIFKSGEDHPVYQKFSDRLELILADPVASLYRFR